MEGRVERDPKGGVSPGTPGRPKSLNVIRDLTLAEPFHSILGLNTTIFTSGKAPQEIFLPSPL